MATPNFMKEVYNGGSGPEFSVSVLKEIIALVWSYVYETRNWKAKYVKTYACLLFHIYHAKKKLNTFIYTSWQIN